jgi:hypothetical protein
MLRNIFFKHSAQIVENLNNLMAAKLSQSTSNVRNAVRQLVTSMKWHKLLKNVSVFAQVACVNQRIAIICYIVTNVKNHFAWNANPISSASKSAVAIKI